MTSERWYTEIWGPTDRRAKEGSPQEHPNVDGVKALIEGRKSGEILRVIAPINASREDLDQVHTLAAQRGLKIEPI
jgi:hypothetical protein